MNNCLEKKNWFTNFVADSEKTINSDSKVLTRNKKVKN
jgi:hypothetical protein